MLYGAEYNTWKQDNPRCGGCGRQFPEEQLTFMPTWQFNACPACVVECNRVDAEETGCSPAEIAPTPFSELTPTPVPAKPSRMERLAGPLTCVQCKVRNARPDSLYCSDSCKSRFLTFPRYACIGNGLYVRTGSGKRGRR